MGPLILPASGPIYLDANGFIYSVERIEPYRTILEPMWAQAQAGQFEIVTSELSMRVMRCSNTSFGSYTTLVKPG